MKATITFNLPEEQEEYAVYSKASDYYCALVSIRDYLRTEIKYKEQSESDFKKLEEIREQFFNILSEYGVEL